MELQLLIDQILMIEAYFFTSYTVTGGHIDTVSSPYFHNRRQDDSDHCIILMTGYPADASINRRFYGIFLSSICVSVWLHNQRCSLH